MKKTNMQHRDKLNSGNISIYVMDKKLYTALINELSILWYKNFNENLSTSDILIKSMLFLRQYLQDGEVQAEPISLTKRYARLGS